MTTAATVSDPSASRAISWLRLPLIIMVVMIHCNPCNTVEVTDTARLIINILDLYVIRSAVPAFFFISGYLFFREGHLTKTTIRRKIKSRIHTLVIPYLIWNVIGLVVIVAKLKLGVTDPASIDGFTLTPGRILSGFICMAEYMPYDGAMWFLRNLIAIVFITPLLYPLLKKLGWLAMLLIFVIAYVTRFAFSPLMSLIYFAAGAVIPISGLRLSEISHKLRIVAPLLWAVCGYFSFIGNGTDNAVQFAVTTITIFSFIFITLNIALRVTQRVRKPYENPSLTFFIYAMHSLYALTIIRTVTHLIRPSTTALGLLDYLLTPAVQLSVCTAAWYLMKRLWPRALALMTGTSRHGRSPVSSI